MKIIIIILIALFFSCSVNKNSLNNDLLFYHNISDSNIFELINKKLDDSIDNYILFDLSHSSYAYNPDRPRYRTQYLFVEKYDLKKSIKGDTTWYFDVFKYTNYNKDIQMKKVEWIEYKNIIDKINNIKTNNQQNCDHSLIGYSRLITYNVIINYDNYQTNEFSLYLPDSTEELYSCLATYLGSVLFLREYEINIEELSN